MQLTGVLPDTARVSSTGHLELGGCDAVELAREFGTPVYVFDEMTLRQKARTYVDAVSQSYPDALVLYASKAYVNVALARLLAEEQLGFDVVSGGELYVVRKAGVDLRKVYFHGNNKTPAELTQALEWGVGRIVIDSAYELELLSRLATERGQQVDVLLRISPGVEAHTHDFLKTGILDSKFGFPISTGQADEALRAALAAPSLNVVGLHCHIGTQIFEIEPYGEAIDRVFGFAANHKAAGLNLREFSPGGGWGIKYTTGDDPRALGESVKAVAGYVRAAADRHGFGLPKLVIEPGRSMVANAGVALYTVGARKEIPGVRTYVSIDGGMGDNIRPAIYGAKYEALVANRANESGGETVTIAGKYCESGDILIRDVELPRLSAGDVLAVPASGAYCLAMASNYNLHGRPAVVLVKDGKARLIRRRESYEDLTACDVAE
ncbi:MAG: diaminopimelate decarboxylase [Chloroflexi bacterium]|nr:diaminopimelate decarboxylase [Chloroflexota bacterium]